ncbi:EamA/RhaT family transporter [Thermococcus sp. M39]|uniref:DMT family transporter n=1 Tax=unclassified Thermococcus TaxID=2627626 RepID=UPI00143B720E|nr:MULTISPECIES: EamA family transporter [unclassified Thermococcus]NJE08214.1 EamA/RhaT family transporter [Thermococcus sp. M39]NJE11707.1 EamA/RhaT family transporter [Thermococcus sp. LS2]
MEISGRVKIILSMLIWGSVGIFARFTNLNGLGVAFFRVSLGASILALLFSIKDKSWFREVSDTIKQKFKWVFLLGTALGLNWVFLFTAFLYTSIARAVLVYYLAPVLAILISAKFLKERISKFQISLILMAFLGLIIIMSEQKIDLTNRDFAGIVFALIAAFFYALIPNLGRFLKDVKSDVLTFTQLSIASIILLPFVLSSKISVGKIDWFAVGILVAVHTVFALFLYMDGLKSVKVNEAALLSYLDPLSAVVYAFLVFGEVPTLRTIIGGFLILSASLLDILKRR